MMTTPTSTMTAMNQVDENQAVWASLDGPPTAGRERREVENTDKVGIRGKIYSSKEHFAP